MRGASGQQLQAPVREARLALGLTDLLALRAQPEAAGQRHTSGIGRARLRRGGLPQRRLRAMVPHCRAHRGHQGRRSPDVPRLLQALRRRHDIGIGVGGEVHGRHALRGAVPLRHRHAFEDAPVALEDLPLLRPLGHRRLRRRRRALDANPQRCRRGQWCCDPDGRRRRRRRLVEGERGARRNRLLHPGVVQRLVGCRARRGLLVHEGQNEVLGLLRKTFPPGAPHVELSGEHLAAGLLLGGAAEGQAAQQEEVGDAAGGPQVARLVVLLEQHFWGDVLHRARQLRHGHAGLEGASHAEVDNLDCALLHSALGHEQQVLRLEIAVADETLVHVRHGAEHLTHHVGRLCLAQGPHLLNLL
mmetsp:Transcript_27076/g.69419  ORF Transcript_27076/g.69419 Transcript_27076/m.69419 type:complete len:359 (+) Transcript_27076:194-1270(+)